MYVIDALAGGTQRFGQLRRNIDGISQRMLTVTLRALERDGLIERQMYPVIPPRVEYSLTPLGRSLLAIVQALVAWSGDHIGDVHKARRHYDTHHHASYAQPPTPAPRNAAAQNLKGSSCRTVDIPGGAARAPHLVCLPGPD